jgi:GNAT superfamily N-acetyltransferase
MTALHEPLTIRPIAAADLAAWRLLWDGYNAFYGRSGPTALPEEITQRTWQRFLDAREPVHALVAESGGRLLGLAHYLFHRSTTRLHDVCYLQDLFTAPAARGQGVGRRLIEAVCEAARGAGSSRVYWQTHVSNEAGRALYDKLATHHGFIVYARDV